jgi:argininosuccinate lyase
MAKLWKKSGGKLHSIVEKYTVGEDYILDMALMPYDIKATKAHVKGLEKIGIIKKGELKQLLSRLGQLEREFAAGKVKIRIEDEDCHTVIENYLTRKYKKLGKKVHTGRSRNDQVLTAMRMYMKEMGQEVKKSCKKVAGNFLDFASKNKDIPLPGYSHTQQAMLSSVGHTFCSYLESLLDDLENWKYVCDHVNKSPLGSAAGFGVPLLLPREFVKKEIGLKKLQINSLYCVSSRGKFESLYLEGLAQIMLSLGRFANDTLLFTSREFDFFKVKNNLVTGSSIMPQKKNHDALEILRANVSKVIANQNFTKDIVKGLISGYHRDMQMLKKPVMESLQIVLDSLELVGLYLRGMVVNKENIKEKICNDIFTADLATEMARDKGVPFRDAYRLAVKAIKKKEVDFDTNIKNRLSLGAPGNLDIHYYRERLKKT